jgi:hypothetical protein
MWLSAAEASSTAEFRRSSARLLEMKVRFDGNEFTNLCGLPGTWLPPARIDVDKDSRTRAQVLFNLLLNLPAGNRARYRCVPHWPRQCRASRCTATVCAPAITTASRGSNSRVAL